MKVQMEWSDPKICQLIKLYETWPCLFNVKNVEYHNRNSKKRALEKIAEEIQITGQPMHISVATDYVFRLK